MLMECCRFGKVVTLVSPTDVPYYEGAVCVTYEEIMGAQACGEAMDGRAFDGREIRVQALGNWGSGDIIPEDEPGAGEGASEGAGAGDGAAIDAEADPLAAFLSSV